MLCRIVSSVNPQRHVGNQWFFQRTIEGTGLVPTAFREMNPQQKDSDVSLGQMADIFIPPLLGLEPKKKTLNFDYGR